MSVSQHVKTVDFVMLVLATVLKVYMKEVLVNYRFVMRVVNMEYVPALEIASVILDGLELSAIKQSATKRVKTVVNV